MGLGKGIATVRCRACGKEWPATLDACPDDGADLDDATAVGPAPTGQLQLSGLVLGGTYQLERVLGEGGMGTVYLAAHLRVPRKFAVKLLNPEALGNREVFERFRREAEIASALGHENIVQVIDFNHTDDGRPYMVLELLDGEDLAERLRTRGRLTVAQTLAILDQLASALEVAHAHGIVHRDLKPQNIFVCRRTGRDDFVKILDFGISKVVHSQSMATRTGAVFGTPNYMSPEQAEGNNDAVDHRTDVFALGAILYECLTGKLAFQAPTLVGIVYQVCHGTPKPLCTLEPDLPPAVEAVVNRALSKAPTDRYQSVRELRDDFARACEGHTSTIAAERSVPSPVAAPTITTLGTSVGEMARLAESPRRRTSWVISAAAVGLLAVGLWAWEGSSTRAPVVAAPAVAAAPAVPAPVVAVAPPVAASEVEVRLVLEPSSARVQLDDAFTSTNPLRLARSDEAHTLVVSAEGYDSMTKELRADHSQDVVARLRRKRAVEETGPIRAPAKPAKQPSRLGPRENDL